MRIGRGRSWQHGAKGRADAQIGLPLSPVDFAFQNIPCTLLLHIRKMLGQCALSAHPCLCFFRLFLLPARTSHCMRARGLFSCGHPRRNGLAEPLGECSPRRTQPHGAPRADLAVASETCYRSGGVVPVGEAGRPRGAVTRLFLRQRPGAR